MSTWPFPPPSAGVSPATALFDKVPDYAPLFAHLEATFPARLKEYWYICALSALTTGRHSSTAATALFHHILPANASPEQAKKQHRHFRELLFQLAAIAGIPKIIEAVLPLTSSLRPEQIDTSFIRQGWTPQATSERGQAWLATLYAGDLSQISSVLGRDADVHMLATDIIYGLFLSERAEISGVESELLVTSSMIAQGVPRESSWHMRALRRLDVSRDEVQGVRDAVERVLEFMGMQDQMQTVPTVDEVEATL